jgi:hypothetical protein
VMRLSRCSVARMRRSIASRRIAAPLCFIP